MEKSLTNNCGIIKSASRTSYELNILSPDKKIRAETHTKKQKNCFSKYSFNLRINDTIIQHTQNKEYHRVCKIDQQMKKT